MLPVPRGTLAKSCFRLLPAVVQGLVARAYVERKKRRVARLETPTVLIFFVTSRCNARCAHCFYWQEVNRSEDELSLDEIRKLVPTLRHPVHLSLTGGEPFLRDDVFEISQIFHKLNGCRDLGIATNGFLPNRIVPTCEKIASSLDLRDFSVQVSLDGLAETHNSIRGVKDGYRKALETVRALQDLHLRNRDFSVSVSITVQKANLEEVPRVVEELLPLKVPVRFALVRGQGAGTYGLGKDAANEVNPMEEGAPVSDLSSLEDLFSTLGGMNQQADYPFWSPRQQEKVRISLQMMRDRKRQLPCYAGKIDGVLYANGDVALCELTKNVGNLRDFGYDFWALWQSPEARAMRSRIRNCFCIHGCNLATSMTLSPETLRVALSG